jgi:hypothetical protein
MMTVGGDEADWTKQIIDNLGYTYKQLESIADFRTRL